MVGILKLNLSLGYKNSFSRKLAWVLVLWRRCSYS